MPAARPLAAAQTVPVRGDVEANLARHLRLVEAAAAEGAGILVFPELSLTGYELDLAAGLAFAEDDPRLAPLVGAASARSLTLVVGAPFREGHRLHVGAFVLRPDRSVEVYTKRHMGAFPEAASVDGVVPPPEATVFQPGRRDPLVHFDGRVAAVAVCADAGRPNHSLAAAERGAGIYLASMFVIPSESDRETENLRNVAMRHSLSVVFANYGGPSGGLASAGGSAIWSADGEVLARLGPSGGGVVVAPADAAGGRGQAIPVDGP